jgi:lipopolysaccharide export LptBFGC system permease protein LptF
MGLLQRYIIRELAAPLIFGLIIFTFIFLVGQIFQLSHLLAGSAIAAGLALELIACLIPGVLVLTAPMGILVAALLGVGRLAADREILAMRACGVHPFRLMAPVLSGGALATGILLILSIWAVPALNLRAADLALQLEFRILSALPANRPMPLSTGGADRQQATFFFEEREPETLDMLGVTIRTAVEQDQDGETRQRIRAIDRELSGLVGDDSEQALTSKTLLRLEKEALVRQSAGVEGLIIANRGAMHPELEARLIIMSLTSGTLQIVQSARPEEPWTIQFASLKRGFRPRFDSETRDGQIRKRPREMTMSELNERIAQGGNRANSARIEFWQRWSVPTACLVMPMLGFPLGLVIRPQGKLLAYAIAFGIILLYYGLLNIGITIGRSGSPLTGLAIFSPNIILGLAGIWLAWKQSSQ